jgi:hypothetical protein
VVGSQNRSTDSVNVRSGSNPTSSANIVKMQRMRNVAMASPPWPSASSALARSARCTATSRVTRVDFRAGSRLAGSRNTLRSVSACLSISGRYRRDERAFGNGV